MRVCGKIFNSKIIQEIKDLVAARPDLTRRKLSHQVCEWLNWRSVKGKFQEVSCRKALIKLHENELIELPEAKYRVNSDKKPGHRGGGIRRDPEVCVILSELGKISMMRVVSREQSGQWNELMDANHYLGKGPLCGAQLRYLIESEKYGYLGGMSFSSATWRLKDRDTIIGWSESARRANLSRIVCNSRFLILPSVKVENLGSYLLSQSVKQLKEDWEEQYGYKPVLLETFVKGDVYAGTCYQAANWRCIGQTAGREKGFSNGKIPDGKKDIYIYPLRKGWRSVLCEEPKDELCSIPLEKESGDWAEEEFGRVRLYDGRLRDRLMKIARDFLAQPGTLIPQACSGSEAHIKAAYRFFKNKQVTMNTLLKPHIEATVDRIKKHPVVLSVQDTTFLNYTTHPSTRGLGPIGTKKSSSKGLVMHDTLAFSEEGTPLGLVDVQCWARDPKTAGKKEQRKQLLIEEKESYKWLKSYHAAADVQRFCPDTKIVVVGDRESDIYELFVEKVTHPDGPELLVRAEESRNRTVNELKLWVKMQRTRAAGYVSLSVPKKQNQPARVAKLRVSYSEVCFESPRGKKLPPIKMWAVYAKEIEYSSKVRSPLEWMLLTTIQVSTFEQAKEKLGWYTKRWGIEVYHRTIKSVCHIEDRHFEEAEDLMACFAIDLVTAWRIYLLTKQSRETPDDLCNKFVEDDEWKTINLLENAPSPEKPPSLKCFVRSVSKLGGFIGRKNDGEPGTITLGRGLQRLKDIIRGVKIAAHFFRQRDGPYDL